MVSLRGRHRYRYRGRFPPFCIRPASRKRHTPLALFREHPTRFPWPNAIPISFSTPIPIPTPTPMVAASLCRSLSAIAHGCLTVRCVSGYPHAHAWYEVSETGMRPAAQVSPRSAGRRCSRAEGAENAETQADALFTMKGMTLVSMGLTHGRQPLYKTPRRHECRVFRGHPRVGMSLPVLHVLHGKEPASARAYPNHFVTFVVKQRRHARSHRSRATDWRTGWR